MEILPTHSDELRKFVGNVQQRTQLESYEEAHQLSLATTNALGRSISGGQAKQLSTWLPSELQDALASQSGQASAFDKANFLEKVGSAIYTVDMERTERQVIAVLQEVRASAPTGELEDTMEQLPPDLAAMFG